jgi:hypothetical protein
LPIGHLATQFFFDLVANSVGWFKAVLTLWAGYVVIRHKTNINKVWVVFQTLFFDCQQAVISNGLLTQTLFFDCQQAVISNGLLTQTLSLLLCSRWVFNLRLLIQASLIHLRKLKTPSFL